MNKPSYSRETLGQILIINNLHCSLESEEFAVTALSPWPLRSEYAPCLLDLGGSSVALLVSVCSG
jgi:hypothetical protein